MKKVTTIAEAEALANEIRDISPDKAAQIDEAVAAVKSGRRDSLNIEVGVTYRLEKYQGEMKPGDEPCEVCEGTAF